MRKQHEKGMGVRHFYLLTRVALLASHRLHDLAVPGLIGVNRTYELCEQGLIV